MANIKISELNELTQKENNDFLPIVDSSANETKKISVGNLTPSNDKLVHVGTSVDGDYRVNFIKAKNLLPNNISTQTINGVTITKNNDKSITLTGTANDNITIYDYIDIKLSAGTYTHSCQNNIPQGMYLSLNNINSTMIGTSGNANKVTFALSEDTNYSRYVLYIASGVTLNNLTIYPMIEKGSIATPYEPYIEPSIYADNEEICNKKDTDIVDITNKLTFATDWSIDSGKLYKQGKHIFGTIQIKAPSSLPAVTNSQQVMQIPYTLPSTYIMGGFTTQGDKWALSNGLAYAYISSNGAVTLVNSSTATFFRLQIDIMEV